jgi:hypothetical protein
MTSSRVTVCREVLRLSACGDIRKIVMNTNRRNMFSFNGCVYETNFPDIYSFVRNPGLHISVLRVLIKWASQIKAILRYSRMNSLTVGFALVACCPHT